MLLISIWNGVGWHFTQQITNTHGLLLFALSFLCAKFQMSTDNLNHLLVLVIWYDFAARLLRMRFILEIVLKRLRFSMTLYMQFFECRRKHRRLIKFYSEFLVCLSRQKSIHQLKMYINRCSRSNQKTSKTMNTIVLRLSFYWCVCVCGCVCFFLILNY